MIYQVAVMERPRKKKDKEKLIWISDWIVADSPDQAGMKAVVENRDQISIEFDDMEILVRPF